MKIWLIRKLLGIDKYQRIGQYIYNKLHGYDIFYMEDKDLLIYLDK
jgi:hypothetical protein